MFERMMKKWRHGFRTIFEEPRKIEKFPSFLKEEVSTALFQIKNPGKRKIRIECKGVSCHFNLKDALIKEWFLPRYGDGSLHEPELTETILEELSEGDVFYDIGANVGYFTTLAAETGADVFAFEMHPELKKSIESNLELNSLEAEIVQKAVSNSLETISFDLKVVPTVSSSGEGEVSVDTITLDSFAENNPAPDIIKIDIEGYEEKALSGAEVLLADNPPRTIFVEVHPSKLEKLDSSPEEVLSYLENYELLLLNSPQEETVETPIEGNTTLVARLKD
ncbi:MAG: FkbM family methyltransferase [Candidatus Nanohaloarchaea archaeon]